MAAVDRGRYGRGSTVNLAYVTDYDSRDVNEASGLGLFIGRSLATQGMGVTRVRLRRPPSLRMISAARKAVHAPRGRTYIGAFSGARLDANARQVRRALARDRFDAVVSPAVAPVAHLDCDQPIVLWLDTTMTGLIDFYPAFSRLARPTVRDIVVADRGALDRCAVAIFSSRWAADVAVRVHGLDPDRAHVVPYGANLVGEHDEPAVREMVRARSGGVCRLLFMGGDWTRKGGPLALEVLKALRDAGVPTEMTLIGPPAEAVGRVPEGVHLHGPVSKSTPDGRRIIEGELSRSHFLVLPTTADCSPVALAEASAFAVPSVTTNIAGIPSIVSDDVNGRMFDRTAPAEAYAAYIADVFTRRDKYEVLALGAFVEYRSRLNWQTAGATVAELLSNLSARDSR